MAWSLLGAIFTYKNLVHAVAGGTGNAFAIFICYPLECARTRLQVDDKVRAKYSIWVIKDIFEEEGIVGVYRGVTSLVLCLFSGSFVYFFVFHGLKQALHDADHEQHIMLDLIFGSVAGAVVVLTTNPLWVINTRLKLQGAKLQTDSYKQLKHPLYSGMYDCFCKILKFEGIWELWSGTFTSFLLISNPAIQFMMYEALKRVTQAALNTLVLSGYYYFLFGALSKTVATVITYPLQLIQTRVRAGYSGKSIICTDGTTVSLRGLLSMYRGLESKLSQTVLTAALMLLTYEEISFFIFSLMGVHPKKDVKLS